MALKDLKLDLKRRLMLYRERCLIDAGRKLAGFLLFVCRPCPYVLLAVDICVCVCLCAKLGMFSPTFL